MTSALVPDHAFKACTSLLGLLPPHSPTPAAEHLNAEVVLGTVRDMATATQWLRTTFLHVRVGLCATCPYVCLLETRVDIAVWTLERSGTPASHALEPTVIVSAPFVITWCDGRCDRRRAHTVWSRRQVRFPATRPLTPGWRGGWWAAPSHGWRPLGW